MTSPVFEFGDRSPQYDDLYEDEDYDALNNETFGDDAWTGDWEEDHEKLAELAELSRRSFNSDIDEDFNDKIESFLSEDDQIDHQFFLYDTEIPVENTPPKPRPPPGFNDGVPVDCPKPIDIANLKNVCTVEEIERNLIKPPPTSLRLEDLERKLISSVSFPGTSGPGLPQPIGQKVLHPPVPLPSQQQFNNVMPVRLPPNLPINNSQPLFLRHQVPSQVVRPVSRPSLPVVNQAIFLQQRQSSDDPYAGLMTQSEKLWVGGIQLMQLQTNQKFNSDYYFLMYQHRQSGGRKMNPLKTCRELPSANRTYAPMQFENSLGKIQAGSVMAPRKIIDTEIVEKPSESLSTASAAKKLKQILLEIEQMYTDVLKAEEMLSILLTNPVFYVNDPSPKELFRKTVMLMTKPDRFSTIMKIRKGKNLVIRVMAHSEVSDPLARELLKLLPGVAIHDSDQSLLRALPSIRHYLHSVTKSEILSLSSQIKPHLSFLLSDKFGVSIVCNILERGESLGLEKEQEWCQLVGALNPTKELERPVVGIPSAILSRLLAVAEPPLSLPTLAVLNSSLATLNNIEIH